MDIHYQDEKICRLCMDSKKAVQVLGTESARKLQRRLSELKAARSVQELPAGRPHPYTGKGERRFSLDLAGGARLLFIPTEDPPPRTIDGGIDWAVVTDVTIVFLGDNHDD